MTFRNKSVLFGFLGLAVLFTVGVNDVWAQSAQSNPALSPWLSMFNNNRGGVLSNYHEYVRPQQEMYRVYQTQQHVNRQQETQQRVMQTEMSQLLNDGSTGRILNEPRRTKSIGGMNGAGYRQYLHYYQGNGLPQGGVPQYATGRRY